MNELHKYATFSVDLLGTPNRINSVFSMGRARIFYKGINRNRSIIEGEVAENLARTIPGTPVIGTYNYDTNDFEGHEENACAYGFIPLNPNMTWVNYTGKDGAEREYLEVDVVIWDGRFEEASEILSKEKHLSMELNPRTMKGSFERIGANTYYKVSYAEFAGITVLGDETEPCFQDAQFITAFSRMVSEYALFVENTQKNDEGGKNIMDDIKEIVEPEVTTDTVIEENATEPVVETEEVVVAEPVIETEVEEVETEVEVIENEVVETVEEAPEAVEFANEDKSEDEETCDKCGKNPCVCEAALDEDDKDDSDDKEDEEEDKEEDKEEFKCNKEDYEALVNELNEYKANYESLQNKYDEALNSLNKYSKKEKLEIINKFSTKLESEELIEKLTANVDNYSLDEIKNELGQALVEQMSAEEDVTEETSDNTNFSLNLNLTDNSLGNSAWDLVKRHKESK